MTQFITHKWLAALGLASSIAAFPALAAKDVVVAVGSNFTTLDPYDANDTLSQAVAKSFYQGLFGLDKDMKVKNVLAEGYTVSDDGLTYTITLRQGVKFQDGADFNAAAVKANLDRASNPDNHLKRYNLYKNIAKTEVVDPATVKITLKQPFSAFINILAHPATAMISPQALEKYGKDIGFHPVGTGPYQLETWNQTDFVKVKSSPVTGSRAYPSWILLPGVRLLTTIPARRCCKPAKRNLLFLSLMSRPRYWRKIKTSNWSPARPLCSVISV